MAEVPMKRWLNLFEGYLEPGEVCSFACRVENRPAPGRSSVGQLGAAEAMPPMAEQLPTGWLLIGPSNRRLIFLGDRQESQRRRLTSTLPTRGLGDDGLIIWTVGLAAISRLTASKAKINKSGHLDLHFTDGSMSSLRLPGPDSRDFVRFLESREGEPWLHPRSAGERAG